MYKDYWKKFHTTQKPDQDLQSLDEWVHFDEVNSGERELVVFGEEKEIDLKLSEFIYWLQTQQYETTEGAGNATIADESRISDSINEDIPFTATDNNIFVYAACGGCDASLYRIGGQAVKTFITKTGGASKGSTTSKETVVVGQFGLHIAKNYQVKFRDPRLPRNLRVTKKIADKFPTKTTVKVAVFDTGRDVAPHEVKDRSGENSDNPEMPDPCSGQGKTGWNFIGGNPNTLDDHPDNHGTNVSSLILNQQSPDGSNEIEILPVKIQGEDGTGDLFSVSCGLAYAAENGAQIIHASFGFYSPLENVTNRPTELVRAFIKKHIEPKNIIIVAAGGNLIAKKHLKTMFGDMRMPDDLRNLSMIDFFPASFSNEFSCVIAVTTVDKALTDVAPDQNFSCKVIDIGVPADEEDGFGFEHPGGDGYLYGSSYAAPFVTGILANYYEAIPKKNKADMIGWLMSKGFVAYAPTLATVIKRGAYLKRHNQNEKPGVEEILTQMQSGKS